jgi:hypothetical protein
MIGVIHIQTHRLRGGGGFMNYAVLMGSGDMIYIPNFIKIGSGIQSNTNTFQVVNIHWTQYGSVLVNKLLCCKNIIKNIIGNNYD